MKTIIVTQARVGSTRLPGKVLKTIQGESMLGIHLKRLKRAKNADAVMVATTTEDGSDQIIKIAESCESLFFQGSLEDVLDRFYQSVSPFSPDWVVRVTSDCPLIDSSLVDHVISEAQQGDFDYCANIITEDFPDGQDVEVFKFSALTKAWKDAKPQSDREHVTPYIRNNSDLKGGSLFKAKDVQSEKSYNKIRMTVDEPADFEMIQWLINQLGTDKSWQEYVSYMLQHPEKLVNADILRNEGYLKSIIKDN
ncbi:glycosyltransferase family protein [uncultured Roseivirga sp.]|uniref:glycosyltransferase family protein n=1 Tax=uncultured Roseivirga sp. TaxID=543088 RepID=UPI0025862AC2|nr:glycosyltransferase family protein [uncultured Roseivirga sp.]